MGSGGRRLGRILNQSSVGPAFSKAAVMGGSEVKETVRSEIERRGQSSSQMMEENMMNSL